MADQLRIYALDASPETRDLEPLAGFPMTYLERQVVVLSGILAERWPTRTERALFEHDLAAVRAEMARRA